MATPNLSVPMSERQHHRRQRSRTRSAETPRRSIRRVPPVDWRHDASRGQHQRCAKSVAASLASINGGPLAGQKDSLQYKSEQYALRLRTICHLCQGKRLQNGRRDEHGDERRQDEDHERHGHQRRHARALLLGLRGPGLAELLGQDAKRIGERGAVFFSLTESIHQGG